MKFPPVPRSHRSHRSTHTGLLLFVLSLGMLGVAGPVYAADRTVVGELFSAEN